VTATAHAGERPLALGLRGLGIVLPTAMVLAAGAGGAEPSLLVLGPLITYALPLIVVVAFWWEDWPGTRLRPSRSGWTDTALIAAGGIVLTALGQWIAGGLDVRGVFDPWAEPRHVPAFPATLPLAAAVFGVLLQLTLVGEGWPLRHLPARAAGAAALGLSWAVGLVLYFAFVGFVPPPGSHVIARTGPVPAPELGAAVACVGVWQVLCFVVLRGRPSSAIESRAVRLACAHALVLGGGLLTYLALRAALDTARVTAIAGCLVAGGLLSGMLFELGVGRLLGVAAALLTAAALFAALSAVAKGLTFTRSTPDDWVVHASLNALAAATILHVAIGRRWPFAARDEVP
jgi:hypothetical protein